MAEFCKNIILKYRLKRVWMKYFVNKKVLFMYAWTSRNKKYVFTDFYLHPNIIPSLADLKKKKEIAKFYMQLSAF